jgi:outer membrane protein assembly factor BamB
MQATGSRITGRRSFTGAAGTIAARSLAGVCLFVAAGLVAQAGEWTEFRGPEGAGHAPSGLPVRWSETENVAWKTPIEGLGWSSPVVSRGRVYLTTATEAGDERSLRLVCLDAATGAVRWNKQLFTTPGSVRMHKKNSHASPTPIVAGERVFVHFGPHGTACTTLDGGVVWQRTLEYEPTHGTGGSPALAGDTLVICCDGSDMQYVVGLDAASGDVRWKKDRETTPKKGFSFATPAIITVGGRRQAVCPGSDAVFAYDPRTGETIWRVDYPGGYSVIPRPVEGAGLLFLGSGYDKPVVHAIDPGGSGNVTDTHVRWKMDKSAPNTPSVLCVGDEVYCVSDNGIATCLDARTGTEHWRQRLGGNYSASPTHAGGLVYFQSESGEAVVVKAGRTFEEVARNQIGGGERTFASYAVDGRSFLIRTEAALYRVGK